MPSDSTEGKQRRERESISIWNVDKRVKGLHFLLFSTGVILGAASIYNSGVRTFEEFCALLAPVTVVSAGVSYIVADGLGGIMVITEWVQSKYDDWLDRQEERKRQEAEQRRLELETARKAAAAAAREEGRREGRREGRQEVYAELERRGIDYR